MHRCPQLCQKLIIRREALRRVAVKVDAEAMQIAIAGKEDDHSQLVLSFVRSWPTSVSELEPALQWSQSKAPERIGLEKRGVLDLACSFASAI